MQSQPRDAELGAVGSRIELASRGDERLNHSLCVLVSLFEKVAIILRQIVSVPEIYFEVFFQVGELPVEGNVAKPPIAQEQVEIFVMESSLQEILASCPCHPEGGI